MGKVDALSLNMTEKFSNFEFFSGTGEIVKFGRLIMNGISRIPEDGMTAHEENEYVFIVRGPIVFGTADEVVKLEKGEIHLLEDGMEHWCETIMESGGELIYFLVK